MWSYYGVEISDGLLVIRRRDLLPSDDRQTANQDKHGGSLDESTHLMWVWSGGDLVKRKGKR